MLWKVPYMKHPLSSWEAIPVVDGFVINPVVEVNESIRSSRSEYHVGLRGQVALAFCPGGPGNTGHIALFTLDRYLFLANKLHVRGKPVKAVLLLLHVKDNVCMTTSVAEKSTVDSASVDKGVYHLLLRGQFELPED